MRVTLIVPTLVTALPRAAQDSSSSGAFDNKAAAAASRQHVVLHASSDPARPKILDRKFLLLAGMAAGATVFDAVTTSHCMPAYAGCQEANPLLGAHPSSAKIYGVSFSIFAGQMLASGWVLHKMPNRNLWMVPPIVATAGHGLAAVLNIRTMHPISRETQSLRLCSSRPHQSSTQFSFPFLSIVHLHFLLLAELTHFFFLLLSAIRMPATVAPDAPPMIPRVLPEME